MSGHKTQKGWERFTESLSDCKPLVSRLYKIEFLFFFYHDVGTQREDERKKGLDSLRSLMNKGKERE